MNYLNFFKTLYSEPCWIEATKEQKVVFITLLEMAEHKVNAWKRSRKYHRMIPGLFVTNNQAIKQYSGRGITMEDIKESLQLFEQMQLIAVYSGLNNNDLIIQILKK